MSQGTQLRDRDPPPLNVFEALPSDEIHTFVNDKVVVFSPGGSSRWYFLEHGDASTGYSEKEQFRVYARRTLERILEIAYMMFTDGIKTIFVIGTTPKQSRRNEAYNRHLGWASRLIVDDETKKLYEQYEMGVLFRGGWKSYFKGVGAPEVLAQCHKLERETAPVRERWLIWVTEENPLPSSLVPIVTDTYEKLGEAPDRSTLCQAYYGRRLEHADIFISNNKPTVEGQLPPLLTVGDLYFTVNPCFYLDQSQWRGILYDHLFARRVRYRDFTAITPESMEEMRRFYQANQGSTLGVGFHHAPSQTWRPQFPTNGE